MAMALSSRQRYHDPRQLWIAVVEAVPLVAYVVSWTAAVRTVTKAPIVPVVTLSLFEWKPRRPWGLGGRERAERGFFRCPGCGGETRRKHCYCRKCARRVAAGIPVDVDDLITESEFRALAKRIPGAFVVGGDNVALSAKRARRAR